MKSVGIKVLRDRLSEYVRVAASGETVLVTDRDQVVAELGPPDPTRDRHVPDAVLADLMRRGLLNPALDPPGDPPPRGRGVMTLTEILADLDEARADG